MKVDAIWRGARLATMRPGGPAYGAIDDGVIAAHEGRIVYAGQRADAPRFDSVAIHDLDGRWVTPGLIDCHTHLVFGGDRAGEFEMRLNGASYEAIARAGGGIASTVLATRRASESELLDSALPRLDALLAEGVTTVEIKSGYGLDMANECKMLRVARALGERRPVHVCTTFLGAHALPPAPEDGQRVDADRYIDDVCDEQLPSAHRDGLVDAVDGFCERIAFDSGQIERVFEVARALSLPVKLHAEQLSNSGGSALAARFQALSADHLEYLDDDGIAALARSGTVAVLLPGAFYFLREVRKPPVEALRTAGVPIAIATDLNPGSSPLSSLLLAMNMGCTLFELTPEEALDATTRIAARALGIEHDTGTLEAGKRCDLAIWDIERPAELSYRMGFNPLHARVYRGQA